MSNERMNEMNATINELLELETLMDELKTEIESLKDEIKAEMIAQDTEVLEVGTHIVRYTSVLTNRFDTTSFKKLNPTIYKEFTKQIASRKFTIA